MSLIPTIPADLTATPDSPTEILLEWDESSEIDDMKISVSGHDVVYNGPTNQVPAFARVCYDQIFENDSAQTVLATDPQSQNYSYQVAVTYAAGIATLASFTGANAIDSTRFGIAGGNLANLTLSLYSANGKWLQTLYSGLQIPQSPTSTTWTDIVALNVARKEPYRFAYYNTDQIDAKLNGLGIAPLASDVIIGRNRIDTLPILFALTSWFTVLLLLVELANTKFLTQKN